jgi:hypothetical protein
MLVTLIVSGSVLAIAIISSIVVLNRYLKTPFDTKKTITDIITAGGRGKDGDDKLNDQDDDKPKVWVDIQETFRLVVRERAIRQIVLASLCAASVLGATVFAVVAIPQSEKSSNSGGTNAPVLPNMILNVYASPTTNSLVLILSTNITALNTNPPAQHTP